MTASDSAQAIASARTIARRHIGRVGGVLTALREIVGEHGFVSQQQQHAVADVFNLSRAEVRGIVSFYHDLKTTPPPAAIVRICQAEACQAVGARELTKGVEDYLGLRLGTANDDTALEAVYCLGLCAQGPSATVDGKPLVRTTVEDVAKRLRG